MNKYQEAYLGIEQFIEVCIGDLYDYENSQIRRDMETIVELVDKATPKKPSSLEKNKYSCPSCSMAFELRTSVKNMFVNNQYCDVCGQALDWSKDNYSEDELLRAVGTE